MFTFAMSLLLTSVVALRRTNASQQLGSEVGDAIQADSYEVEARNEVASGDSIYDNSNMSQEEKDKKLLAAAKTLATVIGTLVGLASGPVGATISIGIF